MLRRRKFSSKGLTLVEIITVSFIISIIVMIAVPSWMRQRETARSRACQENLTKIDAAKELYAMENNLSNGTPVEMDDLVAQDDGYLKREPVCPAGGEYLVQPIGTAPSCTYYGKEKFNVPPHRLPVLR